MGDQNPIEQAKLAINRIFEVLNVARVVYVDDANVDKMSIEDIVAATYVLDTEQLNSLIPEFQNQIPEDKDVLRQKITDWWSSLEPDSKLKRGKELLVGARLHDGDEADDVADASILSDIIPTDKLINLSPSQWEEQKTVLLNEINVIKTLFLFDRDFSDTGGDTNAGIKIIASLLTGEKAHDVFCGLLTHTVSPDNQPESWTQLSQEYSIPKDRFVLIPKQHLSKDPILFAQTLKFTALSFDFTELKRTATEIISRAATAAAARVEEVNIYDLDHIVFQISAEEGLWEPDMLFRLHSLFHRQEARRLAHEEGALESLSNKLRSVSSIPTNSLSFSPPTSTWSLQREELYDFGDHINNCNLPLEVGDIFVRSDIEDDKKYIVLAQPCDLMVRSNGQRQPELKRIALAEIAKRENTPHYSEELPYFGSAPSEKWFVFLKRIHYSNSYVLDLCVFNFDGGSRIALDAQPPSNLRPSLLNRYDILTKLLKKEFKTYKFLLPEDNDSKAIKSYKEQANKKFDAHFFGDDLFHGNVELIDNTPIISYNCKRVGRLSRTRALGLLMSYTSTLNRPAYDRDFTYPDSQ